MHSGQTYITSEYALVLAHASLMNFNTINKLWSNDLVSMQQLNFHNVI